MAEPEEGPPAPRGALARIVEAALPARLGRDFRWLLATSWISNLCDGVVQAAGPLLVASLTADARLIALAATMNWLPPMLLSLPAGVVSDRVDRRRIIQWGNAARVLVLGGLVTAALAPRPSILVVLAGLFLLGCVEVFVDNTVGTVLPMIVTKSDLGPANVRSQFGFLTLQQMIGPPIGAALFGVSRVLPMTTQIVLIVAAVITVSRIRLPPLVRPDEPGRVVGDLWHGLRAVVSHPALRTLVLTIFVFNLTYGAAWSVLVIYGRDRLGLGGIGFGLITTVQAVGGLLGTFLYSRVTRRLSLGALLRAGLIIETCTHFVLAATTSPWLAMPVFLLLGAHEMAWGTTVATLRQRSVPTHLQGRVRSVFSLGMFGGLVIGSLVGGALAEHLGVTAPFWYAGIGSAVFVVGIWHQLRHLDSARREVRG